MSKDKVANTVKEVEKFAEVETTKIYFPELGAVLECDAKKLQAARQADKRGYATFNGQDENGEELAIAGISGACVPVSILLNDPSVKSKGKSKTKRKMLGTS
jgi:hypothetical protein